MIPLKCEIKNYDWGKKGSSSLVAKLMKQQDSSFVIDENLNYAELWMGIHPLGESRLKDIGKSYENKKLSLLLKDFPELIGTIDITQKHGFTIPFLFKVLSIEKPLSIQVHPNKTQAKKLNLFDPTNYPDQNHKPEIAIAISEFEALCSFRTHDELEFNLNNFKIFSKLIGQELIDNYINEQDCFKKRSLLKKIFMTLNKKNNPLVFEELDLLENQLNEELNCQKTKLDDLKKLFLTIKSFYPKDIGCLSVFLLNYIKLKPGQSIFLDSGEPHCYLKGDCIECMANSDNTIRAGLTPKHKDLDNLIECLTFNTVSAKNILLNSTMIDFCKRTFRTKAQEFCVDLINITIDKDIQSYTLDKKDSGSIIIVMNGFAKVNDFKIYPGFVFFLPAMTNLKLNFIQRPLILYRAYFT